MLKIIAALFGTTPDRVLGRSPDRASLIRTYRALMADESLDEESRIDVAVELAKLNAYHCDTAILPVVLGRSGSLEWKDELIDLIIGELREAGVGEGEIRSRFAGADRAILDLVDRYLRPRE